MLTIGRPDKMGGDTFKYYNEFDRKDDLIIEGKNRSATLGHVSKLVGDRGAPFASLNNRHIEEKTFKSLTDGLDPKTGKPLLRSAQLKAEAGKEFKHRAGWDLQLAPDKSVSVAWAMSDEKLRHKIKTAHQQAVDSSMHFIEKELAYTKVGAGGKYDQKLAGLMWTRFDHSTSRDLDPQLHSHSFVYNIGLKQDGTFAAVNSEVFFNNQKLIDQVYQAELANRLEKVGFQLSHNAHGGFKIDGIPRFVTDNFSKRHYAILDAIDKYGYRTSKGFALAAERTRGSKILLPADKLHNIWQDQGASIGFGRDHIMQLFQQQRGQFKAQSVSKDLSKTINQKGFGHSFGAKPIKLDIGMGKSLIGDIKGRGSLNRSDAGRELLLGIMKDNQRSVKGLARGATSLAKMAMPGGAAQILAKAAKLSKAASKAKGRSSSKAKLLQQQQTTRAPKRDKEQDRER